MTLRDDLVRILLDAGVYDVDDTDTHVEESTGIVADTILTRLAETSLQGATEPAPEGTATPRQRTTSAGDTMTQHAYASIRTA